MQIDYKKEIGKLIKRKRKSHEISQNKMAKKLGYSTPQFISNIERGTVLPPLSKMKNICKILKLSTTEVTALENLYISYLKEKTKRAF